ncbi:MAG: fibronectin type III domain-containing protein [Dysgonamonadaceae bacterium]|jgi:hypothetical protein|nr:fibronectin type III domain-containing protein [Dysgonamonadaceae bacterium]
MKRITSILIAALLFAVHTKAQINSYSFTNTTGTYSEISGGTVVYSGAAQSADTLSLENYAFASGKTVIDEVADVSGFPIGFDFSFGSTVFNSFAVNPNGFIYLGNGTFKVDAVNVGGNPSPAVLSDDGRFTEGAINLLGFSRTSGNATATIATRNTEISYLLSGADGSRTLTVQFKKITLLMGSTDSYQDVDFQLKLYQADNRVEFIFNNFSCSNGNIIWAEAGLKGNVQGNTKYVSISQNSNWNTATAGVTGNVSLRNVTVPDGLTFSFTPPPACATPTVKPADLVLTATSTSISGTFTGSTDADKHLVMIAKNISMIGTKDKPTDNVVYNLGDTINSKWKVIYSDSGNSFKVDDLDGSTNYTILIFAFNDACLNGPKYFATSAGRVQGNATTLPALPELSLVENGFEAVKLAATANSAGDEVIIAKNVGQWAIDNNNNQLNDGLFGTPTSDLSVGDAITGGGTVIYKGAASEITASGLTPNTLTNFAAWSYKGESVSSTVSKVNVLTWGILPYVLDFGQFKPYDIPEGWEEEGGTFRLENNSTTSRGGYLSCNSVRANSYNSITTQYLKLGDGASRLVLDGSLTHMTSARPYTTTDYVEWADNDSIVLLVQKYGETDFTPVYTFANADGNAFGGTFAGKIIPISGYSNETVKLKLAFITGDVVGGTLSLAITKYIVEEIPEYEAPINLAVDSIVTSNAKITWQRHSEGEETAWEIRWRKAGQTWSEPIETSVPYYYFTDLPTDTTVEVEVRASVLFQKYSPWTLPLKFNTGYGLPYFQNFDGYTTAANFAAGEGWTLTDATNHTLLNSLGTLNLSFRKTSPPSTGYALAPPLDFGDGSVNYTLKLQIAGNTLVEGDSVYVVIADKDGDAYTHTILKTYSGATETGFDEIALTGLKGVHQVGFYIYETVRNTSAVLSIDSLSIASSCTPLASNLAVSGVSASGATLSWEGTSDKWLVFLRKAGETAKTYSEITENSKAYSGLDAATTYEFGITNSCSASDTAKVSILTFTTLATAPCASVANITATPTTSDITLEWTSEAASFKVKFREAGKEEWSQKTVTVNSVKFTGLTHNTEYEYTIQALCSAAEGDASEWTAPAKVKTLEITCFAPYNLLAYPLGHNSATISWEGAASKYELVLDDNAGLIVEGKSKELTGLTPETQYSVKVRSICSAGDTSVWSPVYKFTTTAIPECPVPTNLQASGITATTALLTWDSEDAATWDLRYREGSVTTWTDTLGLTAKSLLLDDLKPNTAYLWRVKAHCGDKESAYSAQAEFTTLFSSIASVSGETLKVFAANGVINILNRGGVYVERVQLFDLKGNKLNVFDIKGSENIMISAGNIPQVVLLKVTGLSNTETFKVIVR